MNVYRLVPYLFLVGFPIAIVIAVFGAAIGNKNLISTGIGVAFGLILWEIIWEFFLLPNFERAGLV